MRNKKSKNIYLMLKKDKVVKVNYVIPENENKEIEKEVGDRVTNISNKDTENVQVESKSYGHNLLKLLIKIIAILIILYAILLLSPKAISTIKGSYGYFKSNNTTENIIDTPVINKVKEKDIKACEKITMNYTVDICVFYEDIKKITVSYYKNELSYYLFKKKLNENNALIKNSLIELEGEESVFDKADKLGIYEELVSRYNNMLSIYDTLVNNSNQSDVIKNLNKFIEIDNRLESGAYEHS